MARRNILLVDDDPRHLRVMEVALRNAGYAVTPGADGLAALARAEAITPDLVIADTALPALDGFALCARLKQHPRLEAVPFLFLSEDGAVESKVRGLELGAEDYLTHPIYTRELVARVRAVLGKRDRARAEAGGRRRFYGTLGEMGVVDLMQTMSVGHKSGTIHIERPGHHATLWFRDGALVDANTGTLQGEDAVYRALTWESGDFDVDFRPPERPAAITASTADLLMEGLRRVDEWNRVGEQLPPLDTVFEVDYAELADRLAELPDEANTLLRLFDGRRTALDAIDDAALPDLDALVLLSRLYFEGVVRRLDGPPVEMGDVYEPVVGAAPHREAARLPLAAPSLADALIESATGPRPAVRTPPLAAHPAERFDERFDGRTGRGVERGDGRAGRGPERFDGRADERPGRSDAGFGRGDEPDRATARDDRRDRRPTRREVFGADEARGVFDRATPVDAFARPEASAWAELDERHRPGRVVASPPVVTAPAEDDFPPLAIGERVADAEHEGAFFDAEPAQAAATGDALFYDEEPARAAVPRAAWVALGLFAAAALTAIGWFTLRDTVEPRPLPEGALHAGWHRDKLAAAPAIAATPPLDGEWRIPSEPGGGPTPPLPVFDGAEAPPAPAAEVEAPAPPETPPVPAPAPAEATPRQPRRSPRAEPARREPPRRSPRRGPPRARRDLGRRPRAHRRGSGPAPQRQVQGRRRALREGARARARQQGRARQLHQGAHRDRRPHPAGARRRRARRPPRPRRPRGAAPPRQQPPGRRPQRRRDQSLRALPAARARRPHGRRDPRGHQGPSERRVVNPARRAPRSGIFPPP
ncbi:MAG: DUF4388 domain-containing protein [Myxococcales bacterium]|nr:DUF4388 domain-containing protein [Myxococcales bacterium]